MISFPANTEIVLIHNAISFACGIDGMCRYCRIILSREPMNRAYFLFINKRHEQMRVFWYDGQGFLLTTKRLSSGKFCHWPKSGSSAESIISFFQANVLLSGGDIHSINFHKQWKKVS